MKKKNILALACVFLMMIGILSGCGGGEEAAYPAEDISCLVPYAAGGGRPDHGPCHQHYSGCDPSGEESHPDGSGAGEGVRSGRERFVLLR